MKLSFLQLNIQQGKYVKVLFDFLKKNRFDIINLQETPTQVFEDALSQLSYKGELALLFDITQNVHFKWGNATLYSPELLLKRKIITELRDKYEPMPQNEGVEDIVDITKNILHTEFEIGGKNLSVLNTHLAWGPNPTDRPYKLEQGKRLVDYVKTIQGNFILSGDFNVTPDSQIVQSLNSLATNHITKHNITNTLNPRLHRVKNLFPSGHAVDYIYTSPDIKTENFEVVKDDLSDHFALRIDLTL